MSVTVSTLIPTKVTPMLLCKPTCVSPITNVNFRGGGTGLGRKGCHEEGQWCIAKMEVSIGLYARSERRRIEGVEKDGNREGCALRTPQPTI